jgi:chromosome segregation ATPase
LEKIPEYRSKIRQLAESEQAARSELAAAQTEWGRERTALETKLRAVQKKKLELEDDLQKV